MANDNGTDPEPASTPGPSAVSRVFQITELLEKILEEVVASERVQGQGMLLPYQTGLMYGRALLLSQRTLLLSQRTCKAFRDTINGSHTLRRALCFERDPTKTDPNDITRNPLLSWPKVLVGCSDIRTWYDVRDLPTSAGRPREVMLSIHLAQLEAHKEDGVEGTWRKMHLFDGAREPIVTVLYFHGLCRKRVECRLENPKLGEIMDLAQAEGVTEPVAARRRARRRKI